MQFQILNNVSTHAHRDDLAAEFILSANSAGASNPRVSIWQDRRSGVSEVKTTFNAATEALAKQIAAAITLDATIRWSTDRVALRVKGRNGWETLA